MTRLRESQTRRTLVPALVVVGARDDPLGEGQLLRTVRHGVEIHLAEVVPEVVLQAVLDVRVVHDAGRQAGRERGEGAGRVREEKLERRVAVEDTGEDEAGNGLRRRGERP